MGLQTNPSRVEASRSSAVSSIEMPLQTNPSRVEAVAHSVFFVFPGVTDEP